MAVADAADSDTPLSDGQIDRMVGAYQDRMEAYRADTIARTETLRVANQARDEAMRQVVDQTGHAACLLLHNRQETLLRLRIVGCGPGQGLDEAEQDGQGGA